MASESNEPVLGSLYHVEMSDGTWHMAEIIQKRENMDNKRMEYYVHYKECKKRAPLPSPITKNFINGL